MSHKSIFRSSLRIITTKDSLSIRLSIDDIFTDCHIYIDLSCTDLSFTYHCFEAALLTRQANQ
jgi:hypothetical protein